MNAFITFMIIITLVAIFLLAGSITWTLIDIIGAYKAEHDISLDWKDEDDEYKN